VSRNAGPARTPLVTGRRAWSKDSPLLRSLVAALLLALLLGVSPASATQRSGDTSSRSQVKNTKRTLSRSEPKTTSLNVYPVGTPSGAEPSGMSPPGVSALPGYSRTYVSNFTGSSPLAGWNVYSGTPGGASNTVWADSHVQVQGGLLQLNAYQDPAFNNEWVTGGLCQCGVAKTYGAYFVRSRLTGPGPTQVELLWPTGSTWPPEIDFNETFGSATTTTATIHYTSANLQVHSTLNINMTDWHTWGVIWTPTSITYTVDGQAWGEVTDASKIPNQPMRLGLQQQTFCSFGWACPVTPESMQVNWVAEYSSVRQDTVTVGSFATNSSSLSTRLKLQISNLAQTIKSKNYNLVTLVGYSDASGTSVRRFGTSRARAAHVRQYLREQLAALDVKGVIIVTAGDPSTRATASNTMTADTTERGKVVAQVS
jgi:outer membrane protein OmpA-like peptidoglycan-associated protein